MSAYDAPGGEFILHLNGAPVSALTGTMPTIAAHSGDIGIGAMRNDTCFDNGEVDGDGNATWEDTIGSRPDDASVNQFDWSLSADVHRVPVSTPKFCKLSQAYVFDGDDTASTRTFNDLATDPSDASASFEMVFKPADFTGQEVLLETGGATDGLSIVLDGTLLWFNVKDDQANARAYFDLSELGTGWQDDFIHMVGVADLDNEQALLYVDGVLRHVQTKEGTGDLDVWGGTDEAGLGSVADAINFGSPSPFDGQIALLRFYPSLLTADEVMANYGALIPEPSTLVLLGLGLVGLGLLPRRSRRQRAHGS